MALARNMPDTGNGELQKLVEGLVADPAGRFLITFLDAMGDRVAVDDLISTVESAFRKAGLPADAGVLRNRLRGLARHGLIAIADDEAVLTRLGARVSQRLTP